MLYQTPPMCARRWVPREDHDQIVTAKVATIRQTEERLAIVTEQRDRVLALLIEAMPAVRQAIVTLNAAHTLSAQVACQQLQALLKDVRALKGDHHG